MITSIASQRDVARLSSKEAKKIAAIVLNNTAIYSFPQREGMNALVSIDDELTALRSDIKRFHDELAKALKLLDDVKCEVCGQPLKHNSLIEGCTIKHRLAAQQIDDFRRFLACT